MLIEWLFSLIMAIVNLFLSLIPDLSSLNSLFGHLSVVTDMLGYIDVFIDLSVVLTILSIVFIRDNFIFFKNIFFGILKLIPFID